MFGGDPPFGYQTVVDLRGELQPGPAVFDLFHPDPEDAPGGLERSLLGRLVRCGDRALQERDFRPRLDEVLAARREAVGEVLDPLGGGLAVGRREGLDGERRGGGGEAVLKAVVREEAMAGGGGDAHLVEVVPEGFADHRVADGPVSQHDVDGDGVLRLDERRNGLAVWFWTALPMLKTVQPVTLVGSARQAID